MTYHYIVDNQRKKEYWALVAWKGKNEKTEAVFREKTWQYVSKELFYGEMKGLYRDITCF